MAVSVEEAFESPRLLLSAARKEIEQLERASGEFFARKAHREVRETDPSTGKTTFYLEFTERPPAAMRLNLYRVVNDLRNALDQAVYGASVALGATKVDNVFFPFRNSPRDLERAFSGNGRCADVPRELHDILRSFEPYPKGNGYPGGDNRLRALGTISNPNKHSVALRLGMDIQGMQVRVPRLSKGNVDFYKTWNAAKNKLKFMEATPDAEFEYEVNLPTFIAFDKTLLDGLPITGFLPQAIGKVASIIDRLEAETRKVLASRV